MSNVLFKSVQAKDGQTAQERFDAMTKEGTTFYMVGTTDLYFGDKKITNAADLATAVSNIAQNTSDISTINSTLTTLQGDEETSGSIRNIIAGYFDELTAADVPIVDSGSYFTATDVEGALAELAQASAGGVASKTVYLQDDSSGQSTYAKVYNLYQGADSSDMSKNTLVGTINIDKDKVVQSGKIVTVTSGVDSDGDSVSLPDGTYIKLIFQNVATPAYINVQDLVDIYTGGTTAEATVSISNANEITVAINKVAATKVIYQAADAEQGISEVTVKAKIDAVEAKVDAIDVDGDIADAIAELDATVSQTASTDGLALSLTEIDGVVTSISGSISANTYDAYGQAANVLGTSGDTAGTATVYGSLASAAAAQSTADGAATAASTADGKAVAAQNDVDALETLVGTLPSGASSSTVVSYISEAVGNALTWEEV